MYTKIKKLSAALLAALALSGALTSCSGGGGKPGETSASAATDTSAAETTVLTDGLPDTNMEGLELRFYHHNDEWLTWAKIQLDSEAQDGDLINDAIFERNSTVEERFNCKISVTGVKQVQTDFSKIVQAGDDVIDVALLYGITVLNHITYISDWNDIPHISWDEVYWNPGATGIFKVGGRQLAATGNYTLSYLSSVQCLAFNKRIYENISNGVDLYKLVNDGKWVFDTFFSTAKTAVKDLDGDGVYNDNDQYGIIASTKGFYQRMITGSDVKFIDFDDEGYPFFALPGNDFAFTVMNKLLDSNRSNPNVYYNTDSGVDNASPKLFFKNGHTLFGEISPHGIEAARDMEDDMGILPNPKFTEAQEEYITNCNIGEIAVIPRTFQASRAEYVGMLMEALSFYSQQNIVPIYKEVMLKTKYSRDSESEDMLDISFDTIRFEFGAVVWQDVVSNVLYKTVFHDLTDTLASTVESMTSSVGQKIKDLKKQVEEMP